MPADDDETQEFWQACREIRGADQARKIAASVTLTRLSLFARSTEMQARASVILAEMYRHRVFGPALFSELADRHELAVAERG